MRTSTMLVLIVSVGLIGFVVGSGLAPSAAVAGVSTSQAASKVKVIHGPTLPIARSHHTATRLTNGNVLLVGGTSARDAHLADVAIFRPARNRLTAAAPLHTSRHDHSATLLPDGRVLVVGGYTLPQQWLDDAEVYDPATDAWAVVPPLYKHGVAHSATLLQDGRVLVVGGCIGDGVCTERVELFDPQSDTWTEAAPLPSDRASHAALLLDNGRVLIAGGGSASGAPAGGDALLYDPQMNRWAATGPMSKPRLSASIIKLPDGRALLAGGMAREDVTYRILASVELYDPATDRWTAGAPLAQPRYAFVLAALPGGEVLAVGGARDDEPQWTERSFIRPIERYDPAANRWQTVAMLRPTAFAAAALLADGRLWVTGGRAGLAEAPYLSETWLITGRRLRYTW